MLNIHIASDIDINKTLHSITVKVSFIYIESSIEIIDWKVNRTKKSNNSVLTYVK